MRQLPLHGRYLDSCVMRWVDQCGYQVRRIDVMLYRESFRHPLYYDLYIDGLYLLLLCVGPVTTLIFMNVRLVQAIRLLYLSQSSSINILFAKTKSQSTCKCRYNEK